MNQLRRTLLCSVAVVMAGCTTFPIPQETSLVRRKTGKLLARDTSAPSKRFAAGFRLDATQDGIRFDILGPLNTTLARLQTHEGKATFLQQGKEPLVDENAEALMEKMLGFSVPLNAALDWTEGRPNRNFPFHRVHADAFEQLGWTVRVLERESSGTVRKLSFTKGTLVLVVVLDTRVPS